jgi:ribosomal protein S18 acetylase RimI-like enzyme
LGWLAVDQAFHGRKLGSALLWDAVQRSLRSEIAVFALIVDAKDDQAEAFYRHHGFVSFGSQPRQLVLPLTNLILKE